MKALTICQPYAHLIVIGEKRVENRTWPTKYRGPLIIHAGKSRGWLVDTCKATEKQLGPMPFGAVVGFAQLVDCLLYADIVAGNYDKQYPWLIEHRHVSGPWCWILDEVKPLMQPVPWKGAQGLFNIDVSELNSLIDEFLLEMQTATGWTVVRPNEHPAARKIMKNRDAVRFMSAGGEQRCVHEGHEYRFRFVPTSWLTARGAS